jgi:small-conductance mechanosensitive channel
MAVDSHVFDITRTIQLAIAPVFLLTAIGTIINVLIARLARAVDRRRILEEHLPHYSEDRREPAEREMALLNRRIILVLWSTALAVLSALMVCLLIGTAFSGAYVALDLSRPVAILFIAAVIALTGCLLLFLREISISAFSPRQTPSPQAAAREALRNETANTK